MIVLWGVVTMVAYSNDSSPDMHESDNEEGNDADAEFTSDGASENVFRGQFSGTEPNDTASPSSQLDSDEPTSQSNAELSDAISENQAHPSNILTDNHGAVVGDVDRETSDYTLKAPPTKTRISIPSSILHGNQSAMTLTHFSIQLQIIY